MNRVGGEVKKWGEGIHNHQQTGNSLILLSLHSPSYSSLSLSLSPPIQTDPPMHQLASVLLTFPLTAYPLLLCYIYVTPQILLPPPLATMVNR